jgi:hypothetical protein
VKCSKINQLQRLFGLAVVDLFADGGIFLNPFLKPKKISAPLF